MSENGEKQEKLPGVSIATFEVAVKVLNELRDKGEFLPFMSRTGTVRAIVDIERFREALALSLVDQELGKKLPREALDEIETMLTILCSNVRDERMAKMLMQYAYDDEADELADDQKEKFEGFLQEKIASLKSQFNLTVLKERARRIATASGPCLEDLDVEVVNQRFDELANKKIQTPFLKFRLRYTEPGSLSSMLRFAPPGIRLPALDAKGFEFEGDETDIDLLIRRLRAAKDALSSALKEKNEEQS